MIDVAIDIKLHHEGPSDSLLTLFYMYNRKIDPLAAGGTVIIANQTQKVSNTEDMFLRNKAKIRTEHLFQGIDTRNGRNIRSRN